MRRGWGTSPESSQAFPEPIWVKEPTSRPRSPKSTAEARAGCGVRRWSLKSIRTRSTSNTVGLAKLARWRRQRPPASESNLRKAKASKKNNWPQKRVLTYAAVGVGVSILGILIAWFTIGGKKSEDTADNRSRKDMEPTQPKIDVTPKSNPKGGSTKGGKKPPPKNDNPPRVANGKEILVYKFDPAEIRDFRVRQMNGEILEGKKGSLPNGIATYALKDGDAVFEVGKVDGVPALSMTRQGKAGDTHIAFELERDVGNLGMGLDLKNNTEYIVRVRYRASGDAQLAISVHTIVGYKTCGYNVFPALVDKWTTKEVAVSRKDAPVRLTFATLGSPGVKVSIASVEVLEVVPTVGGN